MRTPEPRTSVLVLLCAVAAAVVAAPYAQPIDRSVWLREFDQLERHMAIHYANLDWMVSQRGLDLAALSQTTRSRLAAARIRLQAELALKDFVKAFRDPHLRVQTLSSDTLSGTALGGIARRGTARWVADPRDASAPSPAPRSCRDLGYDNRRTAFRFPFTAADGWHVVSDAPFPAGTIGPLGVVRIAHFGEDGYRDICDATGVGTDERDTRLRVRAALQQRLRSTLQALSRAGVRTVLVDITGNGGGTEWVVDAAALFTDRPLTRVVTPVVGPACDRQPIWDNRPVCGIFGPPEEVSVPGTGAWTGAVAILTDGGTASASEDFVVRLRESGVARVFGERTYGAGCGYADGGAPARLTAIGLEVLLSNCARFTRDGRNEIEGLEPDVVFPISSGSARHRVELLLKALEQNR